MGETPVTTPEQRPANLNALQRALRNLKAKAKPGSLSGDHRPKNIQEPLLVIRGK